MDDAHQGLGIGTRLMRHLAAIPRNAGITALIAEVPPENAPMLKVFVKNGLAIAVNRAHGFLHVTLDLSSSKTDGYKRPG